ncbi:MAG TPA: UDP-N-acetylmuramate--L-alanine ligase [Thermodesulfobacteriota bacterium]|nr:UDP-N-acetylmuramate--L-alanine ligase [Thermodesulfobacteriota bacterium]HNU71481.1 UDP-N-acetylmuramate--L-alanine ligase [Thermodesulfobacteriota bacterium]HQO77473.1 UDP-N-acetylmuramate--L-alanine ligase [Thermodesulfobacteriota bacterium]
MYNKPQRIFMVGIGGSGMSGIAEVLLNLGHSVSGSDVKESTVTRRLRNLGAQIDIGHDRSHVHDVDVVVYSSAILSDNPELQEAAERMIPIIPRAEMLAELMRMKYGIAVAGTHGKTTTTSLVAAVLAEGKIDPTVIIGGKLNSYGTNAKLGQGDFLVAEADESDGSFLTLSPIITAVTNIDSDHLNYYHDLETLKKAFIEFNNKVPFYGLNILCLDDANVQSLIPSLKKRSITYGLSAQADYQARDISFAGMTSQFQVAYHGELLGAFTLNVPGRHNVQNALVAIVVARELDVDLETIRKGIASFSGVERRFQIIGETYGVTVVDDYGHHPTEIKVTLDAVRQVWPDRRLIVVFQPHRYSRTQLLFAEFVTAFYQADTLVLTRIYPAGEQPIEGVSSAALFQGVREHGHKSVTLLEEREAIIDYLLNELQPSDVVLTLGAGDIWMLGETLVERLRNR